MNRVRAMVLGCIRRLSEVRLLTGLRPSLLALAHRRWADMERFEPSWLERIELMARYLPDGASVVDLGCGPMWLKSSRPDLDYLGVDYTDRGPGSVVADFNKRDFPDVRAKFAFVSGCLEYVTDVDWFVSEICKRFENCVLSYCSIDDQPSLFERRRVGWVNDYSTDALSGIFSKFGFRLNSSLARPGEHIFVFARASAS